MDTKLCKLFVDVDKLFTKGNVNETLFNTSNLYKKYCPNGKCNTNYDRIGALCEYLLAELPKLNNKPNGSKDNVNQYYEYVFMWLADKFRKANNEGFFTLDEYYEEFLVNHNDNFNYWYELDNKMHLKDSNIILMVEFYYLFTNICNMLLESEKSELDLNKIKMFDHNCFRKYYFINSKAFKCNPYIELLTNLKKKYDEYKSLIIKKFPKNVNANTFFSNFPPINNSNNNHPEQQFESKGCELLHVIYQRPGRKYKPKKRQKMLKPPPDDLKIKKDEAKSNKSESNTPPNDAEKNKESQKDAKQSTIKEKQSPEPKAQEPKEQEPKASKLKAPETKEPKRKVPCIPRKRNAQVQALSKSSKRLQERPPNNKPVTSGPKTSCIPLKRNAQVQILSKYSSNDLKIKKDEANSNKGESNKPTNDAEKNKGHQNDAEKSTIKESQSPEPKVPEPKLPELKLPEHKAPEPNVLEFKAPKFKVLEFTIPEFTVPELTVPEITVPEITVPDLTVPEHKTYGIPQNGNTQVQTLSKSPEKIQEGSPNNNPVSPDAKDTPKDMGSASENHVNHSTIPKNRSKRSLSLPEPPPQPQQSAPLSHLPEQTDKKMPVKPENKAADSNDKFSGTGSDQEKENLPNFTSQNQEEPPKTKNPDSPSPQPADMQKSMEENQKPSDSLPLENSESESSNFEKIKDYSINTFKKYSSLFNGAVTKVEDYIHDVVTSKINDINDNFPKYQKIIQTINFPKNQIQVVNGQQKEPGNSQKKKAEQPPSTKTTEETPVNSDGILSKLVGEPGNNVMGLSGNIAKLLSFKFEGYKVAIMALMAVSIPIVLIIMYKYLYYGCGKTSKKKKMVKKIINSQDGKRRKKKVISPIDGKSNLKTVINSIGGENTSNTIISPIDVKMTLKTIINPIDDENTTNTIISPNYEETNVKTIIDSDSGEKTTIVIINSYDEKNITIHSIKSSPPKITALNAYKHIFANPAPFISLFFLLIFFVYKRKYNFL
ncbi:CIR protein [Plasmodium chabaudi chabaudi]|uniref:CIR protein n=1 Tax=Plasmodium chabaudi chabaudi TaxID=31271 RepID=A0A1C6WKH7_PLACU|nr:CIR protein [Plasmodium chabaudi chabaudi]